MFDEIGKHRKQLFYSSKTLLTVVEFIDIAIFLRNDRFDVILTSVTIIKLNFLGKLFNHKSLVGIEISKHQNILSLAHLIALE